MLETLAGVPDLSVAERMRAGSSMRGHGILRVDTFSFSMAKAAAVPQGEVSGEAAEAETLAPKENWASGGLGFHKAHKLKTCNNFPPSVAKVNAFVS